MNTASKNFGFDNVVKSCFKQEPDKENDSKQASITSEVKGFERKGWNVNTKNPGTAIKTVETKKVVDNSVLSESFKDLSINKPSHGGLTINGCKNLGVH